MTYNIKRFNSLYEYLRESKGVKDWKKASFKESNSKCAISKRVNNLEVHHLNKPFIEIVKEALEELNLKQYNYVTDYTTEELTALEKKVADLHKEYGLGIVMHFRVHNLFHTMYGANATREDFYEFKKEMKRGK